MLVPDYDDELIQKDLLETKSLFHFQTSPPTGHNTSLDSKELHWEKWQDR